MKQIKDKDHREKEYNIGDQANVKLQPYQPISTRGCDTPKLHQPHYYGPYKISKHVGVVTYELQLPSDSKIHPVFHVSQLKPHHYCPPTINSPELPSPPIEIQPAKVLQQRIIHRDEQLVPQLLIQWHAWTKEEATWFDYSEFLNYFPDISGEAVITPN